MRTNNYSYNYYRYQLTHPFEGSIIYKTRNVKNAAKRCYKEFRNYKMPEDDIFIITNLDNSLEYKFKLKDNKIYNIPQIGGDNGEQISINIKENEPIKTIYISDEKKEIPVITEQKVEEDARIKELDNVVQKILGTSEKVEPKKEKIEPEKEETKIIIETKPEKKPEKKPEQKPERKCIPSCVKKDVYNSTLKRLESYQRAKNFEKINTESNNCLII